MQDNILLIRLKSIGDVLFTLPAVHAVRENFPHAKLTFLVSRENAPLLRGFSEIDEVIGLDRSIYRSGDWKTACLGTLKILRELRAKQFSLAIDFQGYGETELLSWWSGAPERWGNVYTAGRGWIYTRGICRNQSLQIGDQNLSLIQQCGLKIDRIRNEYCLPSDALDDARKFFAEKNLEVGKPTLFIQPFTSTEQKNWPLDKYLALARYWSSHGTQIIFGGGPKDHIALDRARRLGFVTSTGVPLLTSAGIVQLSSVIVGGITGLLHIAVAMQKRVVMLIGYPAGELGFPYQHHDWAVTSPFGGHVSEIEIGSVIEACAKALNEQISAKSLSQSP